MIRAVVVDVDDTLCLTEAVSFELVNEVLARIGRAPMAREVHVRTWGMPLYEAMPLRSPGVDLAAFGLAFDELLRRYQVEERIDVIAQENLAAIDRLAADGHTIMVLTSRKLSEMEHLLSPARPLAKRLTAVYHADNTRYRKPDPRAFAELLAHTGFAPSQCLYVGDSPGDAAAATGAGLRFVACLQSGLRQRADFASYPVDDFIPTFPDLVNTVARLVTATPATT